MSSDRAKIIFLMVLFSGLMLGWAVWVWLLVIAVVGAVLACPVLAWRHWTRHAVGAGPLVPASVAALARSPFARMMLIYAAAAVALVGLLWAAG